MLDLDKLIDEAAGRAELSTSLSPRVALARATTPAEKRRAVLVQQPSRASSLNQWTPEEEAFVAANLGQLHLDEIARRLGRTRVAVNIYIKRDMDIPAASKHPDILTAEQIAEGLHVDGKSIHALIDRGILPGRRLPADDATRVVRRVTLLRFITNWRNWVYFDPERVGKYGPRRTKQAYDYDFWARARRLVQLARSRWHDEWWTPSQVARHHKVSIAVVNNAVHDGRLTEAVKWQNWRILKSVAVNATHLHTGKGSNTYLDWSAGLDELIVLGTAVGLSVNALAAYSGLKTSAICYRRAELQRKKLIAPVIETRGLAVDYTAKTGVLFADWKKSRTRFKALATALDKFEHSDDLTARELTYVRGVLAAWAERFYHRRDRANLLRSLMTLGRKSAKHFRQNLAQLQRAGIDPYQPAPAR